MYDTIIIGAGPAGLNAALYCKRAGLNVLILDKYLPGGNLNKYPDIENVLGFGKIESQDLLDKYLTHLQDFGVEVIPFEEVKTIQLDNKIRKVITDNNEYECYSIIIATGTTERTLHKGEEDYIGSGVHYCAICDGSLYKDKEVVVIGGGNSALENALYLSEICSKVTILQNLDKITADDIIYQRVKDKNIEIICGCNITDIDKQDKMLVTYNIIQSSNCVIYTEKCDGVFINIGLESNLEILPTHGLTIAHNKNGIQTDINMQTTENGIFAIGDVRQTPLRQVSTAIADGSIAAMSCVKYLKEIK